MADLVHLQLVTPNRMRRDVTDYVVSTEAVCNIVVLPDAASQPDGDFIAFDVVREAINDVLAALEAMGVAEEGSIAMFRTDLNLSAAGDLAEQRLSGDPDDTVIWRVVAARLRYSVDASFAYIAFFVVASIIAAVGIFTDSPVLIVGAMVVGPEYGALAALAFGIQARDRGLAWQGASTFAIGAACAITAAALTAVVVRLLDRVPEAYADGNRPMTAFITDPDLFTILVAVAAAVAGMLALTQDRAGTLVGVLISVTTIPAIAEIGVGIAFGNGDEVVGAATVLGINLICLVSVGVATLAILRRMTPRLGTLRVGGPRL